MSEVSHEVGNGHRILTIPDFKLNFARREANQAGSQQHQTSQARSLRLVTRVTSLTIKGCVRVSVRLSCPVLSPVSAVTLN